MPDENKPSFNLDEIDFGATIRGHQKGDRVFDRFVLQKLLGRGGMGVVWLALDERLGREVALKFAPEAIRYDDLAVEDLKEETRKGLALAHPNIVRIYDFLLDEDHASISMEFIDGENLGALRARQPGKVFEPHELTTWVSQLLDALDYAHRAAKVIHRDLKPANLMIDRQGHLRITDFGIARSISEAMDRATLGRASTGTLAYMSPQQAGGKTACPGDDIYSFGSTLYELLTGKPPFFSGNISQQLKDDAVTPPSERRKEFGLSTAHPLPVEWEQTILACLEKNVENRPANAHAIMERLGLASPARRAMDSPAGLTGAAPATGFAGAHTAATSYTAASIRPGAGLTEIAAPGRALTASRVRVALPETAPPPPPPPPKGAVAVLLGTVITLLILGGLGYGGWWGWDNYGRDWYEKTFAAKEAPKPDQPKVQVAQNDPPPVKPDQSPVIPPIPPKPEPEKPVTPPLPPPAPKSVQEKIAAAKAGDTIVIDPGLYEEPIIFKDGVNLKAAEPGKVTFQTPGKSGAVLMVDGCATGSISGIVFQHSGSDVVEEKSWPVALVKSSGLKFDDCTFRAGIGDGVSVTGAGRPTFTKCTFSNNRKNGIVVDSGSTAWISQCTAQKNGASGAEMRFVGTASTVSAGTFSDNNDSGITIKDGASATIQDASQCNGNGEAGIAAAGEGVSITVSGALCTGNKLGVTVQDRAKAVIRDSTVRDSTEMGVHFVMAATGCEVAGNTIEKSSVYGLLFTGAPGATATISGNKVNSNALCGILIVGEAFAPLVEKNECGKNGEFGILVAEGAGGRVHDNICRGNIRGPIGQQNPGKDLVVENNITDEAAK